MKAERWNPEGRRLKQVEGRSVEEIGEENLA